MAADPKSTAGQNVDKLLTSIMGHPGLRMASESSYRISDEGDEVSSDRKVATLSSNRRFVARYPVRVLGQAPEVLPDRRGALSYSEGLQFDLEERALTVLSFLAPGDRMSPSPADHVSATEGARIVSQP
jgi:hypothetical protein